LNDGVLLVNLGTPSAPTTPAVRRYLAEFLSDPSVVRIPRIIWLPLLYGIILMARPAAAARRYRSIWTDEGSPLALHTARQAALLAQATGLRVEYGMRYGEPTIAEGLARLADCRRRLVLPLYPQYTASTTQSVRDRLPPGSPFVEQFHDHPAYIAALAALVRRHWEQNGRGDRLILSYHGLPQSESRRGDPYERQCHATSRLLAGALGLGGDEWMTTFQSRFGPAAWLQPYTEPTLVDLARAGVRRVDVFCPGFASDCLETLEEIAVEARATFLKAGGREFYSLPCLNESPEWIDALARIAREAMPAAQP
jgi:ferrochelatase